VPDEVTQADTHSDEFSNFSEAPELTVQPNTVAAYQTMAHAAAQTAVAANLGVFLPCSKTAPTDACVTEFVRNRVSRAFGRPLADSEVTDLIGVYHVGAQESPSAGVRLVIEATLQSPSFLYRTELGTPTAGGPAAKTKLTVFELADAVAFALLDSVPDDALWARAQDGTLANADVLAKEVDRLLATPTVQANLAAKASFWLGIEKLNTMVPKNTTIFPEFTAQLKADLYASARLFVRDLMSGTVSDLLTSRRMYLNANLAKVYGISGVTSTSLVAVDGPDSRNAGILTQPAVLAAWSHPDRGDVVHRGLYIYNALVCGQTIPPPPANATAIAAGFPKDATERELAGLRATNAAGCGSCHGIFDPFGIAFENYDTLGRYRTSIATPKGSVPVDASWDCNLYDIKGKMNNAVELSQRLAESAAVRECMSRQLASYAFGERLSEDEACTVADISREFTQSGGNLVDLIGKVAAWPALRTRNTGGAQ